MSEKVELTQEELDAKIEEARQEALASIVEGTTWKDAQALKESALNADKKISEQGGEIKTLRDQLTEVQKKIEAPASETKTETKPAKPSAEDVVKSLTEKEAEVLDGLIENDPELKKKIATGGVAAQAEAINTLREQMPPEVPDKLFGSIVKGNSSNNVKLDENSIASLLSKTFEKSRKKGLTPPSRGGSSVAPSSGGDEPAYIRGGGGLAELAQEGAEIP